MKKIFFLAAATAAMMLAGCADNGNGIGNQDFPNDDPNVPLTSLNIRLLAGGSSGPMTRMFDAKGRVDAGTNQLDNAHIFILDPDGDAVLNYASVTSANELAAIQTSSGWAFPDPIPANSKVYVLGNVHSDYNRTIRDLESLDGDSNSIKGFTSDIWTQVDYNHATMANENGSPVDVVSTGPSSTHVSVNVSPVISRLELHALEGRGEIKGFSVTGVFITNFYSAYTYGGGAHGAPIDNMTLATNGGMTGDDMAYPSIAIETAPGSGVMRAEMTGNRIWAYNIAAKSLPLLIVRLENVMIGSVLNPGPMYLNVSGYGGTAEFAAGRIYRIPALSFNEQNLVLTAGAGGGVNANPLEWGEEDNTTGFNPDVSTPSATIILSVPAGLTNWASTDDGSAPQSFTADIPVAISDNWNVNINQTANYFDVNPGSGTGATAGFDIAPAAENTSVFARYATIRVDSSNAANETATSNLITIRQDAAPVDMAASAETPSLASVSFDSAGNAAGGNSFTFKSNVGYWAFLSGPNADKFTLTGQTSETTPNELTQYTLTVTANGTNSTTGAYSATITIRNNDGNSSAAGDVTIGVDQQN